jgi:hypothetical protein
MESNKYYGIYRGTCYDNNDPENKNRITLTCPQVLASGISNWAYPVNPVTGNANHLDHLPHLAADVAALLNTHSTHTISGTTGTGGSPNHTHSFSTTASHSAHSGNSNKLTHAHVTSTDALDNDGSELGKTPAEHTYHREVPDLGQGVWVMFEGGDSNFPLWVGVF